MTLDTPTHYCAYNGQSSPTSEWFSWLLNCLQCQKLSPLQRQRSGLYAHLYKKERNGPASADLAYLHPAKTATMHRHGMSSLGLPTSLYPTLLLARYLIHNLPFQKQLTFTILAKLCHCWLFHMCPIEVILYSMDVFFILEVALGWCLFHLRGWYWMSNQSTLYFCLA